MDENKYSELLTYYMDGELDPSMEPGLFAELSNNPELQAEMDDFMAIRNSIQSETEAAFVPADATEAVFSAIGFSIPEADFVEERPATGSFTRNYLKYATVLLFFGVIAYLFVANTDKDQKIDNLQTQINILSNNINNSNGISKNYNIETGNRDISEKSGIPVVSSEENNPKKNTGILHNEKKDRNLTLKINDDKSISSLQDHVIAIPVPVSVEPSQSGINTLQNENINNINLLTDSYITNYNGVANPLVTKASNSKYTVYLRGITRGSFPVSVMPSQAEPVFSYMSIGIFRSFKSDSESESIVDDIKFGIDFGQEPFSQSFYQVKRGYKYTSVTNQNPMLFWCTAACRIDFTSPEFMYGVQPYSQIEIGGTDQGPISKAQAGLQYNISNTIGVNVGVEGSAMLYYMKPSWFISEKLSLIYGMSIKF